MTKTKKVRSISFVVLSAAVLGLMTTPMTFGPIPQAFADGDFGEVIFECNAPINGVGRAIMHDGTDLFYTTFGGANGLIAIHKIDTNCILISSCLNDQQLPIGAMTFDPADGNAWVGSYDGFDLIWKLDPNDCSTVVAPFVLNHGGVVAGDIFLGLIDGIALDTTDNTLWVSDDLSTHIHHITPANAHLGSCNVFNGRTNSGLAYNEVQDNLIATSFLGIGADPRISEIQKANAGTCNEIAGFSTVDGYLPEGLNTDSTTFPNTLVVWSNEATFGTERLRAWVIKEFDATKDCRFTNVEFNPVDPLLPANLGQLLPTANGDPNKFDVDYVIKPKQGTVSSTNPGQVYCVITITGNVPFSNVHIMDDFGAQFDVNPAHVGGGVEVIQVDSGGFATVLTDTGVIVNSNVDNTGNDVDLWLDLSLGPTGQVDPGESLMIYIKFKTSEKGDLPLGGEFVNDAAIDVEGLNTGASATIELFS